LTHQQTRLRGASGNRDNQGDHENGGCTCPDLELLRCASGDQDEHCDEREEKRRE
jgi:hypothetical protein